MTVDHIHCVACGQHDLVNMIGLLCFHGAPCLCVFLYTHTHRPPAQTVYLPSIIYNQWGCAGSAIHTYAAGMCITSQWVGGGIVFLLGVCVSTVRMPDTERIGASLCVGMRLAMCTCLAQVHLLSTPRRNPAHCACLHAHIALWSGARYLSASCMLIAPICNVLTCVSAIVWHQNHQKVRIPCMV